MNVSKLKLGDAIDELRKIATASVSHIVFDPPFGVLAGHQIETKPVSIPDLFVEINRVSKHDSFIVFFGMMPTCVNWCLEAAKYFIYCDHIIWAKRNITSPYLPIQRSHESIFVYKKSQAAKYVDTQARFEDLKTPALYMGVYELSTVKTVISDLQRRLRDRKYDDLYYSGMPTANGAKESNDEYYKKKHDTRKAFDDAIGNASLTYATGIKNDEYHTKSFDKLVSETQKRVNLPENRDKQPYNDKLFSNRYPNVQSFRYRSKWSCNVTNLWSFLPENQTRFGANGINVKHPTVKPLLLMERIIKLISQENDLICDPFCGSGSTLIAAKALNRQYIGIEREAQYVEIAKNRLSCIDSLFTAENQHKSNSDESIE